MKLKYIFIPLIAAGLLLGSCSSVRVVADYDTKTNFNTYKTYAFYKTGIDRAQISDLDKKRILKAIEIEMASRGFEKSENPDLLVSIFTKEREQVDVYSNGFNRFGFGGFGGFGFGGFGFGGFGGFYNPFFFGGGFGPSVSTRTEGSLYIDLIDKNSKGLVWQGRGAGTLNNIKRVDKREARIQKFVSEIFQEYPPTEKTVAAN